MRIMNNANGIERRILVVNAGSSSLKFSVYQVDAGLVRLIAGKIDRIGQHGRVSITWSEGNGPASTEPFLSEKSFDETIDQFFDWLGQRFNLVACAAVGHRVVHGGPRFDRPTRVDAELLSELGRLAPFDPEHLPFQIGLMNAIDRRAPGVAQVACFDTAFHRDLPDVARRFAIPRRYYDHGIRRFGFHGLSFAYLMEELARLSGGSAPPRVVLAHLGNGASLAAVLDGRCIDTTMGLSPAGGIPMSTRSGDLDPGLIQYLWATEGMTPDSLRELTNRQSGLLGISGVSGDMRELLDREPTDPHCREAVDLFCNAVRKQVGAYAATLGGLDAVVFSGGVGENSSAIRARICKNLDFLGIILDDASNSSSAGVISKAGTRVTTRVIPTDEETMIARETIEILREATPNIPMKP